MIKRGCLAGFVVAYLALPAAVGAQTLWRGAAIGQDLPALQRALPGSMAPAAPLTLSAGEVEGLSLPGQSLEGAPGEAHLFLRDGRLSSVQLQVPVLPVGRSASNVAFARRVAQTFTKTEGRPYSCVDDHFAAITRFECKWLRGEVVIHESYLDVNGQAPLFYVAYRRADDPAFDS